MYAWSSAKPAIKPCNNQCLQCKQCNEPFACPFHAHCKPAPAEAYPVELLPAKQAGKLAASLRAKDYGDLREVPEDEMGDKPILLRIHQATCSVDADRKLSREMA